MNRIAKKVNILTPVDIEKVTIKRDHYFPNAYIIDIPLDSVPDHVWQDFFEREWKLSRHLWDRKIYLIGDKIRLLTTIDNLEDKLDWVKRVVEQTNIIGERGLVGLKLKNEPKRKCWKNKLELKELKKLCVKVSEQYSNLAKKTSEL